MTQQEDILALVDSAYQAAVDPSLWPDALARAGELFGGHQTVVIGSETRRTTPSERLNTLGDPLAVRTYLKGFEAINPIQAAMDRGRAAGFSPTVSTDETYLERRELERSDFYNGYFSRFDMHNVMMMTLAGRQVTLNVMRPRGRPLFDAPELDLARAVRPALSRAFDLSERMQAVRAVNEGLAAFVERSPGAVILAGGDGRVVHANSAAEALTSRDDGLRISNGVLQAADAELGRRLAALIGHAAANDAAEPRGGNLTLPRPIGRRPLSVLVSPARTEFGGEGPRLALVSIVDPDQAMALPLDRIREMFGLTRGQARIVAELVAGHGPRAIGERLGLSHHTVRGQLAHAMAKTETSRQSDLVSMVMRALVGGGLG